uniref:ADP-ribosyl cyclase/cyclic ADP-ribose hydrolase 1 n=2 Tax=Oryctolagus cuniculus TaxID=9986 RepID=A0A5F9D3Z7_RABIT
MPDYEFSPASGDRPRSWISKQVLIVLGVCLPVILALAIWVGVLTWRQSSMGATDHVSAIVLGRCLTYTRNMHPELRNQDCKKILNTFTSAFVSKDPCNITKEDYQPLIDLVTQTVPCNKTLFWSRSKELAHQYSGIQKEMFTLEDTLLGYIADNLVWCGDPRTSEVKEEFCPYRNENCSSTATSVFWTVVSQKACQVCPMRETSGASVLQRPDVSPLPWCLDLQPPCSHQHAQHQMHRCRADVEEGLPPRCEHRDGNLFLQRLEIVYVIGIAFIVICRHSKVLLYKFRMKILYCYFMFM